MLDRLKNVLLTSGFFPRSHDRLDNWFGSRAPQRFCNCPAQFPTFSTFSETIGSQDYALLFLLQYVRILRQVMSFASCRACLSLIPARLPRFLRRRALICLGWLSRLKQGMTTPTLFYAPNLQPHQPRISPLSLFPPTTTHIKQQTITQSFPFTYLSLTNHTYTYHSPSIRHYYGLCQECHERWW